MVDNQYVLKIIARRPTRLTRRVFAETKLQPYNKMREIVHMQTGQCGNQTGAKVSMLNQLYHTFRAIYGHINGFF